tara:strand:+ start:121 stop:324 length:204 start_codon:yes stop_codon:yes gene_type:complete
MEKETKQETYMFLNILLFNLFLKMKEENGDIINIDNPEEFEIILREYQEYIHINKKEILEWFNKSFI